MYDWTWLLSIASLITVNAIYVAAIGYGFASAVEAAHRERRAFVRWAVSAAIVMSPWLAEFSRATLVAVVVLLVPQALLYVTMRKRVRRAARAG